MPWLLLLIFFGVAGGINYLILRARPGDRPAIAAFLDTQQQEQVSVRRGWRRFSDHVEGRPAISALVFPSGATRIYVLLTRDRQGNRFRWRVGFDPWSPRSGLLVLSRRQLPHISKSGSSS